MARQTLAQAFAAKTEQPARPLHRAYLTAQGAAEYLGLPSVKALYWHIAQNSLPTRRIGRRYRFAVEDLDRWMARSGVNLTTVTRRTVGAA